jgi:hypothetical protein
MNQYDPVIQFLLNSADPSVCYFTLIEVVDEGRRGPNEMITLNALRVLKAAGRV